MDWARACAQLEAVRVAVRARGANIVVVILQPEGAGLGGAPLAELAEERVIGLCRQAGVERRYVVKPPDRSSISLLPNAI